MHRYLDVLSSFGHKTPHSFPTRRSSDLLIASAKTKGSPQLNSFGPDQDLAAELLERGETKTVIRYLELCRKRSEEHTSELQSPDHLVCRLLLEKKKLPYLSSALISGQLS